jgi:hypothetical protein
MTVPANGVERLMHFVDARIEQLQLSKADVERRGGPSRDTLRKLQGRSGQNTPLVGTLLRYDDALGWYRGSAAVTLLGGQPLSRTAFLRRRKKPEPDPLTGDKVAAHLAGLLGDEIAALESDRDNLNVRISRMRHLHEALVAEWVIDPALVADYEAQDDTAADAAPGDPPHDISA